MTTATDPSLTPPPGMTRFMVDPEKCIGCEACNNGFPKAFKFDRPKNVAYTDAPVPAAEYKTLSHGKTIESIFGDFAEEGLVQPTYVIDYPVEISPFARATDGDPTLTERFEYFAGGMELGNAFTEINDAEEQEARFEQQSEHVEGERGDPDYVEALAYGMPPTGGIGLGIDRLTMLLTGRETICDVILFPALREPRPQH